MNLKQVIGAAVGAALVGVVGCAQPTETTRTAEPIDPFVSATPVEEVVIAQAAKPEVQTGADNTAEPVKVQGNMLLGQLYFPTGEPGTSTVRLEKLVPSEVQAGKPFQYDIKVTNLTKLKLTNVVVSETVPGNFKIKDLTDGNSDGTANVVPIKVPDLAPGETRMLRLEGIASQSGPLPMCASVSYNTSLCMAATVVAPALKLATAGPAEVMLCDQLPYKLTVTNAGSGQAKNVKVESVLPEGLLTQDGKGAVSFDAGTLAAGESREFAFVAKASRTGTFAVKASAKADEDLSSESAAINTAVKQPVLVIAKTGQEKGFIGAPIAYEITVTNKGDAVAKNTVIYDSLPQGAVVQALTEPGRADRDGRIRWDLGELKPGESKKVSVVLTVEKAGEHSSGASVQATCAVPQAAMIKTTVTGVPAIALSVADQADPVRVGDQTTYLIEVTNQGTAPGTGIKLVCTLEDPMDFISAQGDTKETLNGKTITFAPIGNLAPKAKAVYKVTVRANKAGDVRFTTSMTSDQLTRPVDKAEATNFFQ